jgi:hypothetical protein
MVSLVEFDDVWPNVSRGDNVSVVATNEPEQRFIMLSRNAVPVHVCVVERAVRVTADDTELTVDDTRFENATPGDDFVAYRGTTLVDTADINSTATTVTLNDDVEEGELITFIYFYWQWWAEAELYSTSRFSGSVTRFHVDDSDRSLPVPPELQDDCELDTNGMYRIYAALNSPESDRNHARWLFPSTRGTYCPSNGSLNSVPTSGTGERAVPGVSSILFGEPYPGTGSPPAPAKPFLTFMTRIRKLSHNDYQGVKPTDLYVEYSDFTNTKEVEWIPGQVINNGKEYGFQLFDGTNWDDPDVSNNTQDAPGSQFTAFSPDTPESYTAGWNRFPTPVSNQFSGKVTHIHFGGGTRRGLPADAIVRIVNTDPKWVGSAGKTTNTARTSGTWFPVYGLGRVANYDKGNFPSVGAIYQGRLALAGFASAPMEVLLSSVRDFGWPGELYNDFTIDAFTTRSENAFDVVLPGSTAEIVQSMGVYQGSLFVAGSNSMHRVFSRGVFDQNEFLTQFTGAVGALNAHSMVATVDAAFLLSSSGVYTVRPSDGLDDAYVLQDMSFKISNVFDIANVRNMRRLSNLGYDPTTKKLYACIARDGASDLMRILVYFVDRAAWTEYAFLDDTSILDTLAYRDNDGTERFLFVQSLPGDAGAQFLRTEYEYPIDYAIEALGGTEPYLGPRPSQTITTTTSVRYQHKVSNSGFNNLEDLEVSLNGRRLAFQQEWVKQLDGAVTLLVSPEPDDTLVIKYLNPTTRFASDRVYHHEAVRRNRIQVSRDDGDYTIDDDTGVLSLEGDNSDLFIIGQVFHSEYRSPVYSYGGLKQYKRFRHWSGVFDQRWYDEVYTADTPGLTAKELDSNWIGRLRVRQDANLSIIYNNEQYGSRDQDLFRLTELLFDISQYDYLDGAFTRNDYANISVPIQGVGYSIQACIWSQDDDAWALSGYQLDGQRKKERYRTGE